MAKILVPLSLSLCFFSMRYLLHIKYIGYGGCSIERLFQCVHTSIAWKIYETSFCAITYANSLLIGWHNKFCCAKQTSTAHFERHLRENGADEEKKMTTAAKEKHWRKKRWKKEKKTLNQNDGWEHKLKENMNDNPRCFCLVWNKWNGSFGCRARSLVGWLVGWFVR